MKYLERVLITPKMAEKMLANNYEFNRKIRSTVVRTYARDMENDCWYTDITNNQIVPICISKTGKLLDGQHRLAAIVLANKPVWMWVQKGLSEESYAQMDNGLKRTTADIVGGKGSNILCALAKMTYTTKNGSLALNSSIVNALRYEGKYRVQPTKNDVLSEVDENYDFLQECTDVGVSIRNGLGSGAPTIYSYFYWLIKYLGRDEALDTFASALATTQPTSCQQAEVCKAYLLRKFSSSTERIKPYYLLGVLLMCYEALRDGRKIQKVSGIDKVIASYDERLMRKRSEDATCDVLRYSLE